jgi:dihydroxy-acid dehydratase
MVWEDLTPAKMLTRANFENGIAVAMAMGCSTNAIIHLVAMSRRAGEHCAVSLDDFDAFSRIVPVIANIRPSGDTYLMEDFYYAGGLPGLMNRISKHLKLDTLTVTGKTTGQNIEGAEMQKAHSPFYAAILRQMVPSLNLVLARLTCSNTRGQRSCLIATPK